ncbi:unnamed protein product [Cladocopium goreaui]|uniref:Uncharacterized protein n=2 Tax=Cladocopium goreaui TaxID=2562237 RepID=A0A9P1DV65_9DINO|nr:unnamed protein product [Cladocopium goreaui]CAI4016037.1 unnamed protein product [Cladocopium goreaui]
MMTGHGAPVDMFESQLDESMVCMEYCLLKKPDELPKAKNFVNLWPGQYGRVLACDDIFMAKFSQGGGSACKYQYMERKEWKGKPLLVYAHCQNRFPYVGVLIHEFRPKIVVEQGICTRDDGLVHAVSWRYSSSGEHICTKFFYANDRITQGNALKYCLDHLVQNGVTTSVTECVLSVPFQPNQLLFKPDYTHSQTIFAESESVRPWGIVDQDSIGSGSVL